MQSYIIQNIQGMSRLDAVVRVLKATGKALHYNIITRQALQQGIIRFTGSQGTAGESMKAFLNKTIRENKTAAIVNMGKGVYGLKVSFLSLSPSPSLSRSAGARSRSQAISRLRRSQAVSRLRQDSIKTREKERKRGRERESERAIYTHTQHIRSIMREREREREKEREREREQYTHTNQTLSHII